MHNNSPLSNFAASLDFGAHVCVNGQLFPDKLKQKMLLFDCVGLPHLQAIRKFMEYAGTLCVDAGDLEESEKFWDIIRDIDTLEEAGFLFDLGSIFEEEFNISDPENRKEEVIDRIILCELHEQYEEACEAWRRNDNTKEETLELLMKFTNYNTITTKLMSHMLRSEHKVNSVPIVRDIGNVQRMQRKSRYSLLGDPSDNLTKGEVVEITLSNIPSPDSCTPWEKIIDFKQDPETRGFLSGLRVWMSASSKDKKKSPVELKDELDWLIFQRKKHLDAHRITSNFDALTAVVVSGAEFAEDIVKVRWGKLAKGIASIVRKKSSLLESEVKAPNQEIEYILRTQEEFS
ncbi:MAG: hypothetical protein AAGA50_20960 [Pseudomonadota bacterium]